MEDKLEKLEKKIDALLESNERLYKAMQHLAIILASEQSRRVHDAISRIPFASVIDQQMKLNGG